MAHHADPSGVYDEPRRVGIMLECSTGELLARAAFMHHDDQGHDALRYHSVLKGLLILTRERSDYMLSSVTNKSFGWEEQGPLMATIIAPGPHRRGGKGP